MATQKGHLPLGQQGVVENSVKIWQDVDMINEEPLQEKAKGGELTPIKKQYSLDNQIKK